MNTSDFDLTDHVALVTGGNAGIGLGMARGLARAGASVAIWGTNPEKNSAARDELEALGGRVLAQQVDVADEDAVEQAFTDLEAELGGVDSCFANAGIGPERTSFADQTLEQWDRVMSVNLRGVFLTHRAAVRRMIPHGRGGSLVTVSSLGELQGQPKAQSYGASKAAAAKMTIDVAVELARHRIRANVILPGFIETDLTPVFDSPMFQERVLPRIPVRRWGEPSDFSALAVYL